MVRETQDAWCHKDPARKQILISPTNAIFHIEIYRGEMADLKRGLENFVTHELQSGFYVVVPEGVEQINWQENTQMVENFYEQNIEYQYRWERG